MRNPDNSTKDQSGLTRRFVRVALPAAYLLSVGITFTLALRVGIALMEG